MPILIDKIHYRLPGVCFQAIVRFIARLHILEV
jgi:hypothetical protein